MKYSLLLLAIFAQILIENGKTEALMQVDMDDTRSDIRVDSPTWGGSSSGILKSPSFYSYNSRRNKTLILSAPVGYSMLASIRLLDFRPESKDILTLYAYNNRSQKPARFENIYYIRNKIYNSFETDTYDVPSGQLAVEFVTSPGYSFGYDGFQLTFTVYATYSCNSNTFRCWNRKCIADSLRCDGHNHCGDRSDQLSCSYNPPTTGSRVVGIVCGGVFLLVAVSCAIFIIVRRATRSKIETQTIVSQPVTSYPPGQVHPPSYGQPGAYYPPPPPPYSQGVNNHGYY